MLKSYLQFIKDKCSDHDIKLVAAFKEADIPLSTMWRNTTGRVEMRYGTAKKLEAAIDYIIEKKRAKQQVEMLRAKGLPVDLRLVKATQATHPAQGRHAKEEGEES